jgi:hypothetical protein
MFKIRRAAAGGLLLTAFLLTVAEHGRAQIPGLPTSSASHSQRVVCDPGLALVAAEGVPGEPRHVYLFEGTCRAQSLTSKAGKTTVTSEHLFPA